MKGEIREATVIISPGTDPSLLVRPVSGVPLLVRTLLSLKRQGIDHVSLVDDGDGIPDDPRLSGLEIRAASVEDLPDSPQIVLPANLVWDDRLLRSVLAGRGDGGGLFISCGNREAAVEASQKIMRMKDATEPVRGAFRIRTLSDFDEAGRLLLRASAKDTDGIVARHLNRRVSGAVTSLLVDLPLSPNTVTAAVALVGAAAIALVLAGGYTSMAFGAFLFVLNSILDGVDGELARLRFQESPLGGWLDRASDKAVMIGFYLAAFARLLIDGPSSPALMTAGILSVGGFGLGLPMVYLYGFLRKRRGGGEPIVPAGGPRRSVDLFAYEVVFGGAIFRIEEEAEGPVHDVASGVGLLTKNDFLAMVYLALALAGRLPWIFWIVAPLGAGNILLGLYGLTMLMMDGFRRDRRG